MRLLRNAFAGCLFLALLQVAPAARAHLMQAGNGAIRLADNSAYTVIAIPVAALSGFDDNGDGLIDVREIARHRASLDDQVSRLMRISSGNAEGELIFKDLLLANADEPGAQSAGHLVAMRRIQWPSRVESVSVRTTLFERQETAGQQLVLRVMRREDGAATESTEAAVLTRHRPEHRFHAGLLASFGSFALMGMEHILAGTDHLLFLLTVLLVGAGWRYWLTVITGFTIAHSVTLGLSVFSIVQVPGAIVEPLIAASIVLMAVDNLVRGQAAAKHRLPVVIGCGLLHGLGIATALTESGLSGDQRVLGLLGFNVGVETGQMLFVAAMLAALALVRRVVPMEKHARVLQAVSAVAAAAGTFWVMQRTFA
jgi:hypothetical protein